MNRPSTVLNPGVSAALGAALLFGLGTPLAKLLLNEVSPWMLASVRTWAARSLRLEKPSSMLKSLRSL